MAADLFHLLLAFAALFAPLVFAWWALSRTARRRAKRRKGGPMR